MYDAANLKKKTEITEKTVIEHKAEVKGTDSLKTTITKKVFTDGTTFKETKKEKFPVDPAAKAALPKDKLKPETKKETVLPQDIFMKMIGLVFIQVIFVTMVYGPIAAFLVELFPTRIRYTSMSLPYHIGNGVFGGLVPLISTRLVEATRPGPDLPPSDPLAGLWYPILIAAVSCVIGVLYMKNRPTAIETE
ncbi:MAG: MFS transporter, partial [Chlorobiales bacterium]|nr:MFS transporter [Chlorobiales bacterium]